MAFLTAPSSSTGTARYLPALNSASPSSGAAEPTVIQKFVSILLSNKLFARDYMEVLNAEKSRPNQDVMDRQLQELVGEQDIVSICEESRAEIEKAAERSFDILYQDKVDYFEQLLQLGCEQLYPIEGYEGFYQKVDEIIVGKLTDLLLDKIKNRETDSSNSPRGSISSDGVIRVGSFQEMLKASQAAEQTEEEEEEKWPSYLPRPSSVATKDKGKDSTVEDILKHGFGTLKPSDIQDETPSKATLKKTAEPTDHKKDGSLKASSSAALPAVKTITVETSSSSLPVSPPEETPRTTYIHTSPNSKVWARTLVTIQTDTDDGLSSAPEGATPRVVLHPHPSDQDAAVAATPRRPSVLMQLFDNRMAAIRLMTKLRNENQKQRAKQRSERAATMLASQSASTK
jgi:hypothetical protein